MRSLCLIARRVVRGRLNTPRYGTSYICGFNQFPFSISPEKAEGGSFIFSPKSNSWRCP